MGAEVDWVSITVFKDVAKTMKQVNVPMFLLDDNYNLLHDYYLHDNLKIKPRKHFQFKVAW